MIDLKTELENVMNGVVWNFVGILDTNKKLHPIPKNIQIQAIFEYMGRERIKKWAEKNNITVIESTNTREYPDLTLQEGPLGREIIAVYIKTGRRDGDRTGFTLGSYWGYFRHPTEKKGGCRLPYGDFTHHWIVGFIYDWDNDADTLHMISNIDLVVQEKWKIASKTTGTGTTTAMASINRIDDLKKGNGAFKSEREFLNYWRAYKARAPK